MEPATVLKYPGSKWSMTDWILDHLPPHEVYVEPFFGSGAVFFAKQPAPLSTINDRDGRVVNLFRTIRDQGEDLARAVALTPWSRQEYEAARVLAHADRGQEGVEAARRFLVWCWQSHGSRLDRLNGWRHSTGKGMQRPRDYTQDWSRLPDRILAVVDRLRRAQIECRPALDVIGRYANEQVLLYADPPYPLGSRADTYYAHEMSDDDHADLLDALDAHPGPALLSGYRCPLYDDRLTTWHRVERGAVAEGGCRRTEALWLNELAARRLSQLVLPLGAG